MVGYSGTPLAKKIGIASGSRVLVINGPDDLPDWVAPLPDRVILSARIRSADIVLLFCSDASQLRQGLDRAIDAIGPDGSVWVAWPKKASGIVSDLQDRQVMMDTVLPTGLVDVKVGAISEVWSGLKFVVRKANRPGWKADRSV